MRTHAAITSEISSAVARMASLAFRLPPRLEEQDGNTVSRPTPPDDRHEYPVSVDGLRR